MEIKSKTTSRSLTRQPVSQTRSKKPRYSRTWRLRRRLSRKVSNPCPLKNRVKWQPSSRSGKKITSALVSSYLRVLVVATTSNNSMISRLKPRGFSIRSQATTPANKTHFRSTSRVRCPMEWEDKERTITRSHRFFTTTIPRLSRRISISTTSNSGSTGSALSPNSARLTREDLFPTKRAHKIRPSINNPQTKVAPITTSL